MKKVKLFNKIKEGSEKMKEDYDKKHLDKAEKKELKEHGVDIKDKVAVKAYFDQKALDEQAKQEEEKKLAEQKALEERLANPTSEDLLKQILQKMDGKKD